jgi:hypothetical protein
VPVRSSDVGDEERKEKRQELFRKRIGKRDGDFVDLMRRKRSNEVP